MLHQTVLLHETIEALAVQRDGTYVDATFGRGGHSRLLLSKLSPHGRLIVYDQDTAAIEAAKLEFAEDTRVSILHDNFGNLDAHLKHLDVWGRIDGILFDLGISSPQVDDAERGFSFLREGPLDMRMDQSRGEPLSLRLKTLTPEALMRILRDYGEERFASKLSHTLLKAAASSPSQLHTTTDLARLIESTIPKKFHEPHKHPATRSFQALRIWINEELSMLEHVLSFFPALLAPGGRAAFISFHSLEDRLVKNRMRLLSSPPYHPRGLPIQKSAEGSPDMRICIKMQKPSSLEIATNPRARSAVLRVMERIK